MIEIFSTCHLSKICQSWQWEKWLKTLIEYIQHRLPSLAMNFLRLFVIFGPYIRTYTNLEGVLIKAKIFRPKPSHAGVLVSLHPSQQIVNGLQANNQQRLLLTSTWMLTITQQEPTAPYAIQLHSYRRGNFWLNCQILNFHFIIWGGGYCKKKKKINK